MVIMLLPFLAAAMIQLVLNGFNHAPGLQHGAIRPAVPTSPTPTESVTPAPRPSHPSPTADISPPMPVILVSPSSAPSASSSPNLRPAGHGVTLIPTPSSPATPSQTSSPAPTPAPTPTPQPLLPIGSLLCGLIDVCLTNEVANSVDE
jgi:hypothetical protein